MCRLDGKIALVTGSSRGIGRAIAHALAAAGARTIITYHQRREEAEGVAQEIDAAGVLQLDLEDPNSSLNAIRRAEGSFGRLDILVNNAAIAQEKPFGTISTEDWDRMMAVNLRGVFVCCQEALPGMIDRRFGRIVNLTSIGGQWGGVNQVHYAVSKAGVIALTRSLAKIYSGMGITANAVAPGLVATDMAEQELRSDAGKAKVAGIPAGRVAAPEEVASVVTFLASGEASYVTGQTINVNGGMYFG